jgi:serine protease Do
MFQIVRLTMLALVCVCFCQSAYAQQLRDSFRRVKSSVVVVHTSEARPADSTRAGEVSDSGLASGVLISSTGQILTAAHVVQGEQKLLIEFADDEWVPARVLAVSPVADVALLQCERVPKSAVPAKLGDSDKSDTGDDIFIVGAPFGLSYTLTVGRISARRPDQTRSGILSSVEFLQTDAVVNAGSSGSPVFNKDEEVIGIVSSIVTDSGEYQGVGFAVTINSARAQLLDVDAKRAGIQGMLVVGPFARVLNIPQSAGFLVTMIEKNSLGERLGLKGGGTSAVIDTQEVLLGGDIILEIDGTAIDGNRQSYRNVLARLGNLPAQAQVRCKILRQGRIIELTTK